MTGTRVAGAVAVSLAAAGGLAASYPAGGPRGLVIAAIGLAVLALLITLAAVPRGPAHLPPRRSRRTAPDVRSDDFPSYRKIAADLGWAAVSMRHYDHVARPLLSRLLAAVLEDRRRLDLDRAPGAVRNLMGADLWPLVDPARPASDDSNAPGVDLPTLARIVTRLEEL
jgi:hypothetical protein